MTCAWALAALLCAAANGAHAAEWSLVEGAQAHPAYHGSVPAKSDVIFSTRFKRDQAPALVSAFGATRVEWGYSFDKAFVASLQAAAPWYGGAINSNGPLPSDEGWAKDFDGKTIVSPHMLAWGGRLVTTTHPETQRVVADQVQRFIDLGARSIQVDDPMMQVFSALYVAGDFNPATLAGFKEYLERYPDKAELCGLGLADFKGDYRDYLKVTHAVKDAKDYASRYRRFPSTRLWLAYLQGTVEEHYVRLRKQLQQASGGPLALSMNLSVLYEPAESNPYFFLAPFADYAMAETAIDNTPQMASQAATARALGLGFAPSIRPLGTPENRVGVATLYAMGGQVIVPWDVYAGNDEKGMAKRYYGSTEEFGDLYRFVRAHPELFDGYETAATVGIVLPVHKTAITATKALVRTLVERQIPFAFVPVGGSKRIYHADPNMVRHLKLLVSLNVDADFSASDLKLLADSKVPRVSAEQLTDELLSSLQPFLAAPGAARLKLYPRAIPGDPGRLVVHLVDEARGAQAPADPSCRRRVGIRNTSLGGAQVIGAKWVRGSAVADVKPELAAREVFFSIPDCPLWGVLALQMSR